MIPMKKWLIAIISIFMLMLAACSETATPSEETSEENESSLTAEEVYEKAMEQMEALQSFAFDMKMEQSMEFGEEETVSSIADISGEMTEDPFMMYQNGSIEMDSDPIGLMEINLEMYAEDNVVYIYEDMFNNWMKGSLDDLSDVGLEVGEEQSPFSHIEDLEEYIDEFTFEQTDDTFIFKLETDSEKFKQLLLEEVQEFQLDMSGNDDVLETLEIEQLHYTFTIDKETFDTLSFSIDFSIQLTENGETLSVSSVIDAEFSNFNGIEEITIPEEVIEEAIDGSDAFGF